MHMISDYQRQKMNQDHRDAIQMKYCLLQQEQGNL